MKVLRAADGYSLENGDGVIFVTSFLPGFVKVTFYAQGEMVYEVIFSSGEAEIFAKSVLSTTLKSKIGTGEMPQ
jgi:hypothetical protein